MCVGGGGACPTIKVSIFHYRMILISKRFRVNKKNCEIKRDFVTFIY